jgi:hypothetical protein
MTERQITSREHWLEGAIETTRAFIEAERAENAYDLIHAAPDSSDYRVAADSEACLQLAAVTLAALEAEIAETRRRSELRRQT